MRLTFARPTTTLVKSFDDDEITLVPQEGLDSHLALNESLPSEWNLPWSPFARLTLSTEPDGTLRATNETRDPTILFKGNVLKSAYLTEGDALAIGDLQLQWGPPERLTDLDLEQLIAEAEALLEEETSAAPPPPITPILTRVRAKNSTRDKKRAYLAGGIAATLFVTILSLGLFISIDDRPTTVLDQWALNRQQALRPLTQEITTLLDTHTTRPTPNFHNQLHTLLERYDTLLDQQADHLVAQLAETDAPFPQVTAAQTLADLQTAVTAAADHIASTHANDLKSQITAFNQLRTTVLDHLPTVLSTIDDRALLQPIFDQAHISHHEEAQLYQSIQKSDQYVP